MKNAYVVAERELKSFFISPLAYVVIALFLAMSGLLFGLIVQQSREASLRGLFSNVSVLFLFIVPAITMRLLAEEQRSGTIEVLLTHPVQEWEIVLGKYLASLGLLLAILVLTLVFPAFLYAWGNPDTGPIVSGYVGVFLQAAAFMAVGLWASSMTQNQIIAAVVTFGLLLILWLSDSLGQVVGGTVGAILSYLSVLNHFSDFPRGVINLKDVVFYLSIVAGGLVLSTLMIQARRLR
ncbi:MAG: ABC transporter permease subunit [Chloroflexi bacterium]|nr:ABC transporter permease subunit [Chloroflexota bacterium]